MRRTDNLHQIGFQGVSLGQQLLRTAAHGQLLLDGVIIRPCRVQAMHPMMLADTFADMIDDVRDDIEDALE